MGGTARLHRLHQYLYKFRNIDKYVPTAGSQPTSLLSKVPSSVHVTGEEEEKMGETQLLPTQPYCKDALMCYECWICESNADDRLVQATA
jgi:hypothetical protein